MLLAFALLAQPLSSASPATVRLRALEARLGGRLGVAALDTGSGQRLDHRGDERFPLCSTFKVLLAGAVLARVDAGQEFLERRIPYGQADLLDVAPVTKARAAEGALTVEELCAATVEVSDNTAANLLLDKLGGPPALTVFVRHLGDSITRLDRREPELNESRPGDLRDTTSPRAMVDTLRTLLLGSSLEPASRQRLEAWMTASTTGRNKLRAGLPQTGRAGDKTGSGAYGTLNDVAWLRPPGRAPILVAAYLTGTAASWGDREAALAEVGRLVAEAFSLEMPPPKP